MPTRIPNFFRNQQSPLGAAFSNLYQSLAAGPTDAEKQGQADTALLGHYKLLGMQGLGTQLQNGFPADAPAPVGTGAASPIAAAISKLAGPTSGAPGPDMQVEGPVSPIAAAVANAAPPPEAPRKPAIDYGEFARNALFSGLGAEKAGEFSVLGNANTYGARDPRTTNSIVGAGKNYNTTAESFDINQNNDLHKANETNRTSIFNNDADNVTSRANNRDNIQKDYGVAGLHERGENSRAAMKGGISDKQSRADQARLDTADIVLGKVDEALSHVGGWTTGVTGAQLSKVPGGEAYTLARDVDTIKANLGFDTLAAMRAASPTGGALGAVSDFENKMLQSTVAALDLGLPEPEVRKNLEQVRKHYSNIKHLIQGKMPEGAVSNAPAPAGAEETWVRGPDGNLMRQQ